MTKLRAPNDAHIAVRLPAEMVAALRNRAEHEDRTVAAVIRRAISAYLATRR